MQPLPDFFIVKTLDWSSEQPQISSESRDLKTITRRLPGHRYSAKMRLEVKPWDYMRAGAWLELMQGDNQFFTYTDSLWLGGVNRNVNGARAAGSSTVALTSVSGVEVGRFVNFTSHDKLYRIVYISGNTITLNTPLQVAVQAGSVANMANPRILLELPVELKRNAELSQGLTRTLGRINLRAQEAI